MVASGWAKGEGSRRAGKRPPPKGKGGRGLVHFRSMPVGFQRIMEERGA